MGAVKKDVLLILYIISIAQITSRGGIASPGHSFNLQGVGTKSEASHAANKVTGKIKEHVSRKGVWRMCDQGHCLRLSTVIIGSCQHTTLRSQGRPCTGYASRSICITSQP